MASHFLMTQEAKNQCKIPKFSKIGNFSINPPLTISTQLISRLSQPFQTHPTTFQPTLTTSKNSRRFRRRPETLQKKTFGAFGAYPHPRGEGRLGHLASHFFEKTSHPPGGGGFSALSKGMMTTLPIRTIRNHCSAVVHFAL